MQILVTLLTIALAATVGGVSTVIQQQRRKARQKAIEGTYNNFIDEIALHSTPTKIKVRRRFTTIQTHTPQIAEGMERGSIEPKNIDKGKSHQTEETPSSKKEKGQKPHTSMDRD